MHQVVADKEWYKNQSEAKGKPTHCPYATVEDCPRYYQSMSLLGSTGSTKIDEKKDKKLLKKWKKSNLWPKIDEQATSVSTSGERFSSAFNYCPEVLYIRFGLFAKSIASFKDEIDQDAMHNYLKKIDAQQNDARWIWSHIEPLHYADCSLYSVLDSEVAHSSSNPWWREHIAKIVVGICLALAAAIIKLVFG